MTPRTNPFVAAPQLVQQLIDYGKTFVGDVLVVGGGPAGSAPSPQETSAGRISVATWPGGPLAAATASTASRASSAGLADVLTQGEQLRATVSMSYCSCSSYCRW